MEDKEKLSLLSRMLNGDFGSKLRTARGRKFKDQEKVHWPVPLPPKLHTTVPAASKVAKKRNRENEETTHPIMHDATMKKHTLVLGMDNTLVSWRGSGGRKDERLESFYVYLRPNVDWFLREMHELFEVVIYTNFVPSVGAAMVNLLENAAGLPPSPYYDATVPWGCFDSRDNAEEAQEMKYAPVLGEDHVNRYLVTQSQTLNSADFEYMKHLPILGRDADSTIIIDDDVQNFSLNPRAGIKISRIDWKDNDDALRRLSPMLRAVAAAPNALRELDHWRPDEYVKCDNFTENMNCKSNAARILGTVNPWRRERAIPTLVADPGNAKLVDEATKQTEALFEQSKGDAKDQQAKATAFSKS